MELRQHVYIVMRFGRRARRDWSISAVSAVTSPKHELRTRLEVRGEEPKVANELALSVIIPNHNYADYVGIAVRSALEIRWPKVEIIVVDDGSTDNSLEVIKTFADRITVA